MASYGSEETWNGEEEEEEEEPDHKQQKNKEKKNNVLPIWGNERTMNLNPLILTNIQSSHYFKVDLYELKTYHEVIDEIYYKVQHLEPWEKGSRKTAGQTGMCGGVRGVGAGGIVSTAYCLLYKLFTLKLTRKQVNGLITHQDSPYIRGLGFMYIRYTQPPADLWEWYDPYLEDAEELDVKAGGGLTMTVGTMLKNFLTKLEWFSTLFPRIPVPIQQKIQKTMAERFPPTAPQTRQPARPAGPSEAEGEKYNKRRESPPKSSGRERDRFSNDRDRDRDRERERERERSNRDNLRDGGSFLRDSYRDRDVKSNRDDRDPHLDRERERYRDFDRDKHRDFDRDKGRSQRDRSRERDRQKRHGSREDRDRSHRRREGSRDRDRDRERRHRDYDHSDLRHKSSHYR